MALVTRAIIQANGSRTRWGDYLGVPKQELVIDGEPLLARTVRLLREHGIADIVIAGPFPGYGVPALVPLTECELVDGRLATKPLWDRGGRTIILMGDVWYSDAAIATIAAHEERDEHLFARFTPSLCTGKRGSEIWANSFWPEHHEHHEASLRTVQGMLERGELERAGMWQAYLLDHGHLADGIDDTTGCVLRCANSTGIDDRTEDFDYPGDFDDWMALR